MSWRDEASIHLSAGEPLKALAAVDAHLVENPSDFAAWHFKATVLVELDRYDEALACLDKVLELDTRGQAWMAKGNVCEILGRIEEAAECFNHAGEFDEDSAEAPYREGQCYMKLGDLENALECFDEAVDADERHALAWLAKSTAEFVLGLNEDGIASAKTYLAVADPRDTETIARVKGMLRELGV